MFVIGNKAKLNREGKKKIEAGGLCATRAAGVVKDEAAQNVG